MRFLLIRPLEDSENTARQLQQVGYDTHIAPLMVIEPAERPQISFEKYTAIIFTSPNAIRTCNFPASVLNRKIYTVGTKTAETAAEYGFKDIIISDGDVEKLAETIISKCDPGDEYFLYPRGADIAGSIENTLKTNGFKLDSRIIYKANTAGSFDQNTISLFTRGDIDFIPFYSPRSALIFKDVIKKEKLEDRLGTIIAICMSPNITNAISELNWKHVYTATSPNQTAMFKLINIDL